MNQAQDRLRKYGYSLRGKHAKALQFYSRGKHISAIAAMSKKGLLECTLEEYLQMFSSC